MTLCIPVHPRDYCLLYGVRVQLSVMRFLRTRCICTTSALSVVISACVKML